MTKIKTLGIVLICLFAINFVYAADNVLMGFQGYYLNATDNSTLETGNLQINISTTNACNGDTYSETFNDPFVGGIADVMLGDNIALPMEYGESYYLCTVVNGEQVSLDEFTSATGEIEINDIDTVDFKNEFVPYIGATSDIDLGIYNLQADDISANQIDSIQGLYNTMRIDGLLELYGTSANVITNTADFIAPSGIFNGTNFCFYDGTGCLNDIFDFWSLGETGIETNYNVDVNGSVTADSFHGDGSALTGLETPIWTNESGVATYQGDAVVNGTLQIGNMEISGNDAEPELSYVGSLLSGDANSIFNIKMNTTLFPASPFSFEAYIDDTASTTAGVLVQKGAIGTYADISNNQLVEGIRFIFDEFSDSQSQGIRIYKGLNNEFKSITQTGGTQTSYGVYSLFNTPTIGGGTGITNLYGSYNDFATTVSFAGSPTINKYGFYSKGIADLMIAGTSNRYGLYLTGYDKGAYENNVYAIYVNDGNSYFGGDINITGTVTKADGIFHVYDSTGGTVIGTSNTNITWDAGGREDSSFTHRADGTEASATVEVDVAGDYLTTFDCMAGVSDTVRSHVDWWLEMDTGSGFSELGGTRGASYHRQSSDGKGSVSITRLITFNDGDIIKAVGISNRATQVATVADGCRFTIQRV